LQEQLQSQESHLGIGLCCKVGQLSSCQPTVLGFGATAVPAEMFETENALQNKQAESPRDPSVFDKTDDTTKLRESLEENASLQMEISELRAERQYLLFERDDLSQQVLQAHSELSLLQADRDMLNNDCKNRGAYAIEFAAGISAVQEELQEACIERDICSENFECAANEVSSLKEAVSLSCFERDDYHRLIAHVASQIVGLRMEKDRLLSENATQLVLQKELHHEYASCRTELEEAMHERDSERLQLENAMHLEVAMETNFDILQTSLVACKNYVEEHEREKCEFRAQIESLSSQEGLCSKRAQHAVEDIEALKTELSLARAEQAEEYKLLQRATNDFASMRTELGCMQKHQRICDDQRHSVAVDLAKVRQELTDVEDTLSRKQIEKNELTNERLSCLDNRNCKIELENQKAQCRNLRRTAEQALQKAALLQSELANVTAIESAMTMSVETAESELSAMRKQLYDVINQNEGNIRESGTVLAEVRIDDTEARDVELSKIMQANKLLQDKLRATQSECSQYSMHAKNMAAEVMELAGAVKSRNLERDACSAQNWQAEFKLAESQSAKFEVMNC